MLLNSAQHLVGPASWRDPALSCASQAGMVDNLNDGLALGALPALLRRRRAGPGAVGILGFTYPTVWGVAQLWAGALSDRWGGKGLIASGMPETLGSRCFGYAGACDKTECRAVGP